MPDPTPTDPAASPQTSAPSPAPAPQPASPKEPTVLLEPRYPVIRFNHEVDGAEPLEAGGTLVPAVLVPAIEAAARKAGIEVVEILTDDVAKPVARLFRHLVRRIASDVASLERKV